LFGRKARFCITYEYGCLPPTSGQEAFLEQVQGRYRLWNKLVEIEKEHIAKVRALLGDPYDESLLAALLEEKRLLISEVKCLRQKTRRGNVDIIAKQAQIKELTAQINKLAAASKERRRAKAREDRPMLDELERQRREAVNQAMAASGLYWGNYDDVRNHYETARRRALREGVELKFRRFAGEGEVSVRYQRGLRVGDVFKCSDRKLQIEPVSPDAWYHPTRAVRRRAARTVVRIRAASDERKKPVWLELPLVMHRPLPPGLIRQASVARQLVFNRFRYKLLVVVELDNPPPAKAEGPTVAVVVGFRKLRDGIRVAYWVAEDGKKGQVLLPEDLVEQFAKLNHLKSVCDRHFNDTKMAVAAWLAANPIPDRLKQETKHLAQWRTHRHLLELLQVWDENRAAGDGEIVGALRQFRGRWVHLKSWESNLRDQLSRHRRELYRRFACGLARQYGKVVIEDFDLRSQARMKSIQGGPISNPRAEWQRTIAAVSQFRKILVQTCRREGVGVNRLDTEDTKNRCHLCGRIERIEAAAQIFHKCSCGAFWDIDENACLNLLFGFETGQAGSVRTPAERAPADPDPVEFYPEGYERSVQDL
jgi:transposase